MRLFSFLSLLMAMGLSLSMGQLALAGLVVSIANAQFLPGQGGTLDIFVRSDDVDRLSNFGFSLRIEQRGATNTQLRFATPQSDSQLGSLNYVFQAGSIKRDGDSALNIAPSAVGSTSTTIYLNDSFVGTDSFVSNTEIATTIGTTNQLLARLDLVSGPGFLGTSEGDSFRVRLQDGAFTQFLDDNLAAISYSSNVAIITVAAVPEPSSLHMFAIGCVARLIVRRRRSHGTYH